MNYIFENNEHGTVKEKETKQQNGMDWKEIAWPTNVKPCTCGNSSIYFNDFQFCGIHYVSIECIKCNKKIEKKTVYFDESKKQVRDELISKWNQEIEKETIKEEFCQDIKNLTSKE